MEVGGLCIIIQHPWDEVSMTSLMQISTPLHIAEFGDAILIVLKLGRGDFMAKIDLRNAFQLCPIRKQDWHLLDVYWQHRYFIIKCLPLEL